MSKSEVFGKVSGFIDKDTEITGDIRFNDSFRIDGKFKGKILSGNTLIIGENGDVEAMSVFARKVNQDYLSFLESVNESVWGDLDALSGVVKFLRTQPKDPITYELMDLTVKLAENRIYLLNETRYLYHELSQSTFETCDNTYTMVNSN